MKKIHYLVLTLLFLLVLAACGQGTTDNVQEKDSSIGTDVEQNEQIEVNKETTKPTNGDSNATTENVELLNTVNLYFSDNELMNVYRIEVNEAFTKNEEGIQNALQLWADGPNKENLVNLVPADAKFQSVEVINDIVYISFSKELLAANLGSTGEGMLIEQMIMIVKQFGYNEIFLLIDGEEQESLLGHVGINEPLTLEKTSLDYELYNE